MIADINTQLFNLNELVKNRDIINKDCKVILLDDARGWSNGYIADIIGINTPEILITAKKKKAEIVKTKVKIQPIIERANGSHRVESMIIDLKYQWVKLINSNVSTYVHPDYLLYFYRTYKNIFHDLEIVLTESNYSPVKIVANNGDDIVGLIMPIRVD